MRERMQVRFGRQEYSLLPSFSVIDQFEDRCGALTAHLLNLVQGTASLKQRATLMHLAFVAALREDDQDTRDATIQSMMQAMFDEGVADDDRMAMEVELCERLLYTPEQYLAKKAKREAAQKAEEEMQALLRGSPMPSS